MLVARRHQTERGRRAVAALGALALGSYAIVALARAPFSLRVEGVLLSITLVPRYLYQASAFLAGALAIGFADLTKRLPGWTRLLTAGAWAIVFIPGPRLGLELERAESARAREPARALDARVGEAARGTPAPGMVVVANEPYSPMRLLRAMGVSPHRLPDAAGAWAIAHGAGTVQGRPFRFVEFDAERIRWLRERPMSPVTQIVLSEREAAPMFHSSVYDGGNALHRLLVLRGVEQGEADGCCWTRTSFAIRLNVPGGARKTGGILKLRVDLPEALLAQYGREDLTVSVAGAVMGERSYSATGPVEATFEVPAAALVQNEVNVEVNVKQAFHRPGDARVFGILLRGLSLAPRP